MTRDTRLRRALLDELFASVPVALAVVNNDLRFSRVNGQLCELHNRPADEFTGITVAEAIPSRADEIEPLILRALAGEAIRAMEFRPRSPGDPRVFKASFIPVVDDDDTNQVLIVLSEHSAGEDVERTLRMTYDRLDLTLEGTLTGMFEWDSTTNDLRWSPGMGPLYGRPRGWTPAGYEGYMEAVHPDDRVRLQSDVAMALQRHEDYEREFRCVWPNGRERWLNSRVRVLHEDGKTVLLGLVSDIHERKVRERADQFLAKASAELGHSLDVPESARRLARQIVPEFCDWCEVVTLDEEQQPTSSICLHGDPALTGIVAQAQARFWTGPTLPQVIDRLRQGQVVAESDLTEDDLVTIAGDPEHLALLRQLGPAEILHVPLTARGRLVGSLSLFAATPARRFGEIRRSIAAELGRRAGIALDNAALMAAERKANHRLGHLQAVTDAALDNLELDDLLTELLRRVRDMTGADFAVVLLRDGDRGDLELRASQGLGTDETGIRLAPNEGIAGFVLQTGKPFGIEDVSSGSYPSRLGEHLRKQVKSVLAVPLIMDDGKAIGVLEIGTLVEHRSFSEDELELLTTVSERVAQAIANASLYSHARETSTILQGSLLPDALPPIEGYALEAIYRPGQQMTDVGGDWYDVFPLPDGRFALALGDVVGRGLRAAILMGQLRAAARAYAREHSDPATVISKVDDLVEELVAVPFATMILLALDPATGAVEAASAGHLPPCSSSRGLLEITPGPALGVPVDGRASSSLVMDPGEMLVLYTDGLVEDRAVSLQSRLDKLAQEVADGPAGPSALLAHLEDVMLEGQLHDDTAVIVLQRLAAGGPTSVD